MRKIYISLAGLFVAVCVFVVMMSRDTTTETQIGQPQSDTSAISQKHSGLKDLLFAKKTHSQKDDAKKEIDGIISDVPLDQMIATLDNVEEYVEFGGIVQYVRAEIWTDEVLARAGISLDDPRVEKLIANLITLRYDSYQLYQRDLNESIDNAMFNQLSKEVTLKSNIAEQELLSDQEYKMITGMSKAEVDAFTENMFYDDPRLIARYPARLEDYPDVKTDDDIYRYVPREIFEDVMQLQEQAGREGMKLRRQNERGEISDDEYDEFLTKGNQEFYANVHALLSEEQFIFLYGESSKEKMRQFDDDEENDDEGSLNPQQKALEERYLKGELSQQDYVDGLNEAE